MSKNILVTGKDGFIGRHLSRYLEEKGYRVLGFDVAQGDIAEADLSRLFSQVDHVVHLAAKTFVPDSWGDTRPYYQTNFMGTINVLEFCRENKCALTYLNTYVYGQPQYLPVDEKHKTEPHSPYNHSKMMAEDACAFYNGKMGTDITILRVFNIFGPNQSKKFLIPEIILQAIDPSKESIEVNDVTPKRDYIYVTNLVAAIEETISQPKGYHIYNIGSGKSYSVKEMIDMIQICAGTNKKIVCRNQTRQNEVVDIYADISKAKKELGFCPAESIEAGLKETIGYFKVYQNEIN